MLTAVIKYFKYQIIEINNLELPIGDYGIFDVSTLFVK